MAETYLTFGPPGCGKTTWVVQQAQRALEAAGCNSQASAAYDAFEEPSCPVLFSSLTRAAAGELKNRGLEIPAENIGTLHAHAFRALGKPKMFDDKATEAFNQESPEYYLSGESDNPDRGGKHTSGDRLLSAYHVARSRMRPRSLWTADLLRFAERYESFKRISGKLDFSDLIEGALSIESAPGKPSVLFVDEAQDHDRAQFKLLCHWAAHPSVDTLIVVGDPDQNLYEWRGSEPEAFYGLQSDPDKQRVLKQSYRVPRAAHALAVKIIRRATSHREVEYLPRDEEGEVRQAPFDMTTKLGAKYTVEDVQRMYLAKDEKTTVCLLASCEYMLGALCAELRSQGIPFWNPFSRERGSFNPLHPSKGQSCGTRLLGYLRPETDVWGDEARLWNVEELCDWTEHLEARGLLRTGAKAELKRRADSEPGLVLSIPEITSYLDQADRFEEVAKLSIDWFEGKLLDTKRKSFQFPLTIARKSGAKALREDPRVIVGTVHSVKGGEADVVYIAPDLSPQGWVQYQGGYPDPAHRMMYVAVTRARSTVVLCRPSSFCSSFYRW